MLSLKLRRSGRKGLPFYHLVVAEKKSKVLGKFRDKIGYYNPLDEKDGFKLNQKKLTYWLSQGVVLSEGVRKLFKHFKAKTDVRTN